MSNSNQKLRVFLSWSGVRSKLAAEAMRGWLPLVLQNVQPYFTPEDIEKGARWNSEIRGELGESDYGIIFLTPENQHSPWILFEAGALSKLETSRVAPVLIGLESTDVSGPLSQMQLTPDTKEEILKLVRSINAGLGTLSLDQPRLERLFDRLWPDLEEQLAAAKATPIAKSRPSRRSDRELLEEILERLRAIELENSSAGMSHESLWTLNKFRNSFMHSPSSSSLEKVRIQELPISVRAAHVLSENGVKNLLDLVTLTEVDLLKMPNMGKKAVNEIKTVLSSINLRLD